MTSLIDSDNTLVLTVNNRLARWLLLQHSKKQEQSDLKIWPTPQIYPIRPWMKQTWIDSWPTRHILTDLQSKKLWEDIIRKDKNAKNLDLLRLDGAAHHAAQAYSLMKEYRLPDGENIFKGTEEWEFFHRCMTKYRGQLKKWNALDPAEVMDAVSNAMDEGKIPVPKKIILAGFDEIQPQLKLFLENIKKHNCSYTFEPDDPSASPRSLDQLKQEFNPQVRSFKTKKEEVIQCARWIRSVYRPNQTIGIITPDLGEYRSIIKKEFSAELAPQSIFPWQEVEVPFNIWLGAPLSREPIVSMALSILSVEKMYVPFSTFSTILKSPFLQGNITETSLRSNYDLKLRKENTVAVFLDVMNAKLTEDGVPLMAEVVGKWKNFANVSDNKLPSEWGKVISNFLKGIGWPGGDGTLPSNLYQTHDSWNECLDEFSSLDKVTGKIHRHYAIATLARIADEKSFQPKTKEEPIQAVGLLEASGMNFDHLWVLGCHADALPALPSPNPFIPYNLQRKFGLPHFNAERELHFAERIMDRLISSAGESVFSYPQWEQDRELTASPLLKSFETKSEEIEITHRVVDQLTTLTNLDVWEDPSNLPATEKEISSITGGQSILKNQAMCPFRAFATHRLHTKDISLPESDFDSRERGNFTHKVLEMFWRKTKTREALQSLKSENRLEQSINDCVKKVWKDFSGKLYKQNYFPRLESKRLTALTMQWMNSELLRPDFEVLAHEAEEKFSISGLKLTLRIDRIDKTEDGKILIIDYKSGNVKTSSWFEERIQEPQLPLYALAKSPDGIAYGQIKKGELGFQAVFDPSSPFTGIKLKKFDKSGCADWKGLNEFWKDKLTATAGEFVEGYLSVDPFNPSNTCEYCPLETLCRKEENLTTLDDED